jgi:hypothetical protein
MKPRGKNRPVPHTLEEFLALPDRVQEQLVAVASGVSLMRSDQLSVPQAAREVGLSPRTLKRLGAPGLRKGRNGRYVAKRSDRLFRPLRVLTSDGVRDLGTRDSRAATLIAEHWNAAHRYLETGDTSVRRRFRSKSFVDANGRKIRLMTDLAELDRQGHAGELGFESIYPK